MLGANKLMLVGAAVAALALLVIVKKKGGVGNAAADAGRSMAATAVDAVAGFGYGLVDGAVTETAFGIGDKLGVPRTNLTECEKAIAEGRTWDASFACPASDFLSSINPFK